MDNWKNLLGLWIVFCLFLTGGCQEAPKVLSAPIQSKVKEAPRPILPMDSLPANAHTAAMTETLETEKKASLDNPKEVIVLLHGLARNARSMNRLEKFLSKNGYVVHNIDYPSTEESLDELVAGLHQRVEECCHEDQRLHFVTYSLGGILARAYLSQGKPPNLGRVVMLAPPNQGSELADRLRKYRAFRNFFGPSIETLGTGEENFVAKLGPPDFEFGIIAGSKVLNPLGWLFIPGESDGTVAVESTKLPGMADFIVVPHSHTFIMNSRDVAEEVLQFIRTGRFTESANRGS